MFYEENQIIEIIRCPYCKNKYEDLRFIECGVSLCMWCIDLLTKNGKNGFECPVCDDFHEKPKKGFGKIINLAKLCDIQASEVSRSTFANIFTLKMNEKKFHETQYFRKGPKLTLDKKYKTLNLVVSINRADLSIK